MYDDSSDIILAILFTGLLLFYGCILGMVAASPTKEVKEHQEAVGECYLDLAYRVRLHKKGLTPDRELDLESICDRLASQVASLPLEGPISGRLNPHKED